MNKSYKEFWQEKEIKYGGKYCYATSASYLPRYPYTWNAVSGLLYLLENMVCFENFKNTNLFSHVLVKEKFQKIEIEIPLHTIVAVTNGYGESSKIKTGFFESIIRSFNDHLKLLLINANNIEEQTYAFTLFEDPFIFCQHIKPFLPES